MTNPNITDAADYASVHSTTIRGPVEIFGHRFEEICTGGNCVALCAELPDGGQILITGYNEAYLPTRTNWSIGFYDADHSEYRMAAADGTNVELEDGMPIEPANGCEECERSYGPHYTGPCRH